MIQEQIEDAKAIVAREVAEFEARYPPEAFAPEDLEPVCTEEPKQQNTSEQQPESNPEQPSAPEPQVESNPQETTDTVVAQTNTEHDSEAMTEAPTNGADGAAQEQPDAHHDDGGEVVEDNEDTVIY